MKNKGGGEVEGLVEFDYDMEQEPMATTELRIVHLIFILDLVYEMSSILEFWLQIRETSMSYEHW